MKLKGSQDICSHSFVRVLIEALTCPPPPRTARGGRLLMSEVALPLKCPGGHV